MNSTSDKFLLTNVSEYVILFMHYSAQEKRMSKRLIWTQYFGFIGLGLAVSFIGPLMLYIRKEIVMDYWQSGLLISAEFIGVLLTTPFGGWIADKIGKPNFLFSGGIIFCLGLIGAFFSGTFLLLFLSLFVIGIACGIYEVGINALTADLSDKDAGKAMNYLHFFFGAGAMLGPIVVASLPLLHIPWRTAFFSAMIFPILVSALLLGVKNLPQKVHPKETMEKTILGSLFLWISGVALFFYVGLEVTAYSWTALYWEAKSFPWLAASVIPLFFWIALTAGRILAGKIADKAGLARFVILTASLAVISAAFWTVLPMSWSVIAMVLVLGLSLAGIYPTVMAFVTSRFPGKSGKIVAFLTIFGSLGGFVIPSGFGKIADISGIAVLPLALTGIAILLLGFFALAVKSAGKTN